MSEIDVEHNIVIDYWDNLNRNHVFDKLKPYLKDFDYENSLNDCVNDLVELYQLPCAR